MDSSKDSKNEVVNLSLMVKNYESDEEVTSSNNNLSISFDELQDAFIDLHKKSVKLAKLVSFSKKTISKLEKEVLKLNEELENLRTEVKTLKPIGTNQSSTIKVINDSKKACNCCSKFIEEIKDLKNSLSKFIVGKNNLDIILGKQRCVFDEARLGYRPDKQQKLYKKFFASNQKNSSPFLTCFYCRKKGHGASTCYFRKNNNNIKMIWVPKGCFYQN